MNKSSLNKYICIMFVVTLSACGGAEERKTKYMERGKVYFTEKNYSKAKIEFKNVVQIDPKHANAYYYMGRLAEKNKDLRKALSLYLKVVELEPGHLDAKAKLAKIYTIVGTEEYISKAKYEVAEIFKKQPGHLGATLIDASLDSKNNQKELAIQKLNKLISEDSKQVEAYFLLASIYSGQSKLDNSINALKQGIQNNQDDIWLRKTLTKLLVRNNGDLIEAEEQLRKIVEISPDNYSYRAALANFYATTQQNDKAEKVLRLAIEDSVEDAIRYIVLIEFIASKRGVKAAENELKERIKNNPNLIELQFALAEFHLKTKSIDDSIAVLLDIISEYGLEPNGIKAKVKLAELYYAKSDIKNAQITIGQVLSESPNDSSALLLHAKLAFMMRDDVTVINSLRTVLRNEPKNNVASLLLSQAHERNNESELSHDTLFKILEVDPLNINNHLNYANYLARRKDYARSLQIIDKALAYFKSSFQLQEIKLKILISENKMKKVEKILNDMKLAHPENERVFLYRGQYYAQQKQFEKSLIEYKTALKYSKNIIEPLEVIVRLHIEMGNENKAFEMLNNRIAANQNDVLSNQLLGQLYLRNKDVSNALELFEKAMKNSKWDRPYISAARIHVLNKEYNKAHAVLEAALSTVGNKNTIQLQRASLYESQREYKKAMAVYVDVLNKNPANMLAANNLASLLVDHNSDEESIKQALKLTKQFDKASLPAYKDTVGWVYLNNNDHIKATSILKDVVNTDPKIPVFQYHLGVAYHKLGDFENAKKHLEIAAESDKDFTGKDKAKSILLTL